MNYWLVKSEPGAYSWETFVSEGRTAWTGVRNFQARNFLKAMQVGDTVLFYHSVVGKEIVGEATVAATAYPDATAVQGDWVCVDLVPKHPLKAPVSLDAIKAEPALAEIGLLRQSRLSVMPLKPEDYTLIMRMAGA